jgi:hypothetical protein
MTDTDIREVEWPPPAEQPEREPSHPGARDDDQDEDDGADP